MLARSFNSRLHRVYRNIHQCSVRLINHEGDTYYKSNMNLINKEDDGHTYIEAFSRVGFRLSSGLRILGPCAVFPKSILQWNVASSENINKESLSLFSILEPKPDILIIGIGDRGSTYDKNIIKFLRSKRINVEILPTEQACSTFNFLNAERRVVAAALIPPSYTRLHKDELVIEEDDDHITGLDERGDLRVLSNPIDDKIGATMEEFRDKGVMGTLYSKDRERERRALERKKKERDGTGEDDDSSSGDKR